MPLSSAAQIVRFDVFELDLRAPELRKHGIRIRLQEQPFLVLRTLLENPGEVVTAEELKRKIWPQDTFVDFDHGLHAAVNRLREKLGDSADNPRYIETIPRRGYRFIGQLHAPEQTEAAPPIIEEPKPVEPAKARPFTPNSWAGVLGGFSIAVLVGGSLIGFNVYGLRDWLFGAAHPHIRALAVLPLENMAADSAHEYISEGITEDLTTQLSQLRNLRVISHTSVMEYKHANKSLRQIAQELKVDAVVEGTVELADNHVRISAQLVDAGTAQQIWAQKYDRELKDVLVLQGEVTKDIASRLLWNFPRNKSSSLAGMPGR